MDKIRYGMTLYDGTIVINGIYNAFIERDENTFIIYFTLLYEIMHVVSLLSRGDENYFLNTDEFTKNKDIKTDEIGQYFEKKFLLCIIKKSELTEPEAKYLLDIQNYQYKNVDDFHKAFKKYRKDNFAEIKKAPSFAISKSSDKKSFSIRIGCYFAGARKINYD